MPHCEKPCGHELCRGQCNISWHEALERERHVNKRINLAVARLKKELPDIWIHDGGWFLGALRTAVYEAGYRWINDPYEGQVSSKKKATISRTLSRKVMEADGYRCVHCETHLDLCCDHIIPESKGGPTTFENLQTLCRSCNSKKGDRQ